MHSVKNIDSNWGRNEFLKREGVLSNYLEEDGSLLVIEVDLQITVDSKRVWYPKKHNQEEPLMKLYSSPDSFADVIFTVCGTDYPAHMTILSLCAKALYEVYKECS